MGDSGHKIHSKDTQQTMYLVINSPELLLTDELSLVDKPSSVALQGRAKGHSSGAVSFSDHIFCICQKNGFGHYLFHFIQVRLNAGMMFFSNSMFESLKIAFHIARQQSTTEMHIDQATLAAACV